MSAPEQKTKLPGPKVPWAHCVPNASGLLVNPRTLPACLQALVRAIFFTKYAEVPGPRALSTWRLLLNPTHPTPSPPPWGGILMVNHYDHGVCDHELDLQDGAQRIRTLQAGPFDANGTRISLKTGVVDHVWAMRSQCCLARISKKTAKQTHNLAMHECKIGIVELKCETSGYDIIRPEPAPDSPNRPVTRERQGSI
jgi:hypothetical protein